MEQTPEERLNRLVAAIAPHPGLADRLPPQVGAIVRQALAHTPVYAIAQNLGISAEAVWAALDDVAAAATGQTPAQPVETGDWAATRRPA